MYSNNTETLMTTEELIGLLNKSALGQLSGSILPGVEYMGVKYFVSGTMMVYDGDHVAGNYYFKTSDGLVRVTVNGTASIIDQATLETQIKALPGNTYARNFEYLSCNKSIAFDPAYGYNTTGQVVGEDTIVRGPGAVCEGACSDVTGSSLYVDAGSSYINLHGAESVISESSYVVGAVRKSSVSKSSELFLFGTDSHFEDAHRGAIYGGFHTLQCSELEMLWRDKVAGLSYAPSYIAANLDIKGDNNAYWGSVDGLAIDGDGNRVGWFNRYMSTLPETPERETMFGIKIQGDGNWIGYNSNYVNVRGSNNYIAAGSRNVHVFGDDFNRYDKPAWGDSTYPYNHAIGYAEGYALMTTDDASPIIAGGASLSATVVGNDNLDAQVGATTYSIVANSSGISQYIGYNASGIWGLNRRMSGDDEIFYNKCVHMYERFPVNQENVFIVGDRNTLPTDAKNVAVWGHDNVLDTATVNNCLFVSNFMHLSGPKYMRVETNSGTTVVEKNIIDGVWWVDLNKDRAVNGNGALSDMNADAATDRFTNAFVFTDTTHMYTGMFYGTVTKSDAIGLYGFTERDTVIGNDTLDGISGYIISAKWTECRKPDTPMVYTGGLALYGGANEATRNQSGYGVLKLGNMYYHCNDLPAPAYDKTQTYPTLGTEVTYDGLVYKSTYVITTAEEWDSSHWTTTGVNVPDYQRTKTNEFITMHLNGQSTTSAGVFKGSVIMTPGTHCCPYAGFPLIVQERQELDGSFHIGVGKICKEALPDDIGGTSTLLYDKVRRFECSYVGITNSLQVREYLDGSQVQYLDPKVIYDPAATATDGTGSVESSSTDGIMTGASISGHRVFSSDGSYTETMTSGVTLHPKNGELIVLDAACFTASYSNGITCLLEDPGMDEIGNEFYMSVYMGVTGGDTMPCSVTGKMVGMDVNMGTTGVYPGVGTRTINFKDYIPGNITDQKNAFVRVSVKKVMDTAAYFFEPIPLPS